MRQGMLRLCTFALLILWGFNAPAVDRIVYFHNDALGSPIAATDAQGNLLWREAYTPYGTRLLKQDGDTHRLWYTGKPEEPAFGIQYFGARWYDPALGRFLSVDPAGFDAANPQSFNRYAYANNNPYKYVDPDGNSPLDVGFFIADSINFGLALASGNGGAIGSAGADLAASAIGLASPVPGTGLAIKAARAADKVGDAARVAYKKPVVIGENMKDRVIPTARARGADHYKPRKTSGDPLKKNERYIDNVMRDGREIIDIGPDPRRSKRSPFYEAEKRQIEQRHYPVTKVDIDG